MEDDIRKVVFEEGKSYAIFACSPPYSKEDIIKEGLPYEEWINAEFYKEE